MRDEQYRRLQRQVSEAPDLASEARLLLEGVRSARLEPTRLELLATAGHPAARAALRLPAQDELALREWVWSLLPWGKPLVVRALLAAAQEVLGELPSESTPLLRAAAEWCDCPCAAHAEQAYRASRIAEPDAGGSALAYHAVMAAHVAGHMKGEPGRDSLYSMVGIMLRSARQAGGTPETLRAAMREAVLAWAWTGKLGGEEA